MKSYSLWSLILLAMLGVGCARKMDDAKISSDVQSKFSLDSGLSAKQITVQSADGVVTLAGSVDNDAQRDAASKQAASVAGVKQVINNLYVGNAPAMAASTAKPAADSAGSSERSHSEKAKLSPGRTPHKSSWADGGDHSGGTPPADSNQMSANNNSNPPAPAAETMAPPPPPPPPAPKKMIVDQGTQLTVRLVDPIDSEKNRTGDTFHATLNAPLTSDGEVVVPAGTDVAGHLTSVKSAGKFAGQSEVVLQLDSISAGGQTYNIQTDQYKKLAASRGKNTAEKVGGGALIGGIIGAIAGGGKGAGIGAAAGAGVGGGVQAATKSQQIKLPSETVLNFTLQAPVTVIQAPNPNADRKKLDSSQ